jgi:hypothetical protein
MAEFSLEGMATGRVKIITEYIQKAIGRDFTIKPSDQVYYEV